MRKKGFIGAIVLAVLIFGGIILALLCTSRVPAGYVGVVYNMNGGVDGEGLSQGWHLVAPTKKVTTYSIGIEQSYLTSDDKGDSKNDESFSIPTSDGKTVRVNLEFSYRFDEARVASTFVTFKGKSGEEIKDTFIKPKIIAWTQEVSANYPVTDIFGDKRTAINFRIYRIAGFQSGSHIWVCMDRWLDTKSMCWQCHCWWHEPNVQHNPIYPGFHSIGLCNTGYNRKILQEYTNEQ